MSGNMSLNFTWLSIRALVKADRQLPSGGDYLKTMLDWVMTDRYKEGEKPQVIYWRKGGISLELTAFIWYFIYKIITCYGNAYCMVPRENNGN